MEYERFDTKLFIDEIQKRPAIWDMENPDYKNRPLRKRSWEEMVELFCDPRDNLEKKKVLGTILIKKWKSIRDNYMREYKKQKKLLSGSGFSKHTPYVHYGRLQFLERSTAINDAESNYKNQSAEIKYADADDEDWMPPPTNQIEGPRKKQKINAVDNQTVDILQTSLAAREQSETKEDDDKLFCLSLCSELRKVPENRRLATKIELLTVIQRAQDYHQSSQTDP